MIEGSKNTMKNFCIKAIEGYKTMSGYGLTESEPDSITTKLHGCKLDDYPGYVFDVICEVRKVNDENE